MAATLFPLGTYTIGTADYSAGAARTAGAYCLVRKRYGNNNAIYNYAAFEGITLDQFTAICSNPDSASTWLPYPYSNYDWQLLVTPLAQPLVPSTAASGPVTSSGGGTTDLTPAVNATNNMAGKLLGTASDGSILSNSPSNPLNVTGVVELKRATTPPSLALNASTESTQTQVLAAAQAVLAAVQGTLKVHPDGTVTVQFAGAQPVTGPVTDAQMRATPLPVSLPGPVSVTGTFWPATQPVSLAGTVNVAGPATDQQLRATPLPVAVTFPGTQQIAGTVTIGNSTIAVTLPATAATSQGQADATAQLAALNNKVGAGLTVTTTNPTPATDVSALAKDATLSAGLGTNGTNPPTIAGTGILGWLRSIYERLGGTLSVNAANLPLPAGAATDAMLSAIRALLAAPVLASGAATEVTLGKLLTQALTVNLPAGAATAALQTTINNNLASILTALAPAATAQGQADQLAKLELMRLLLASGATAAKQDTSNTLLTSILNAYPNLATGSKQDTGNTTLASILTALGPAATASLQTAANTLLSAIQTSTAAGATAAGQTTLAGKQDATNAALANLLTAVGLTSTAAKQDVLATLQTTANGYLQTLVTTGVATTAGPANAFSLVTANGTNATVVNPAASKLFGGQVTNTATAYRCLFLYDLATLPAGGTLPTTKAGGLLRTIGVPPNGTVSLNLPANRYTAFASGLTIAGASASAVSAVTTSAAGLTGSVGLTAGDLIINLDYL